MVEPSTKELTDMACSFLAKEYPDAIIVKEMSVQYMSASPGRLDVAAITKHGIVAVEVKGPKDSPARIADQITKYEGVCKEIWLLAAKNIAPECFQAASRKWKTLDYHDGEAFRHPNSLQYCKMQNSPWAIVDTLLISEKRSIVREFKLEQKLIHEATRPPQTYNCQPHTGTYSKVIAENVALCDLMAAFAKHMYTRKWEKRVDPSRLHRQYQKEA